MKIKILSILLALLFISACSSSKFEFKDVDMESKEGSREEIANSNAEAPVVISVDKIYSWIDLLPGPDQTPRIQVSGSISIPNSDSYDLEDISLKLIKIYQNGTPYFLIKPVIRTNKREESEYSKEFIFSTITGLKLVPGFNSNRNIDIEFLFDNDGEMFTYTVPDQKIEKAN